MSDFLFQLLCILMVVWVIQFIVMHRKNINTNSKRNALKKEALTGERFTMERENQPGVEMNLYRYDTDHSVPLIMVFHGGALIDGDADMTDTFCEKIRSKNQAFVCSLNYKKLGAFKPPFQQQEIIDTVLYFRRNASQYNIDPSKVIFIGFSGGSYLSIGAAGLLHNQGFDIAGLISFYPLLDDSIIQLTDQHFLHYPITVVSCNNEEENKRIETWCEHLSREGCEYEHKSYPDAIQGFIEYNNPEYLEDQRFARNLKAFDEDQKDMAVSCEMWLTNTIQQYIEQVH